MLHVIFAQTASAPDPTVVLIGGVVFVVGAAVVSLYQRFNAATQRAINEQIAGAILDYRQRNKDLENQLCVTRQQLATCETDRAALRVRCEYLECPHLRSSPKPSDPA